MHKITATAIAAFAAIFTLAAYDLHTPLCTPIKELRKPAGEKMAFVKDGKAAFAIVIDKDAEKRAQKNKASKSIAPAVKLLQKEFKACFGIEVEVVDENDAAKLAEYDYRLLVGDSVAARAIGLDAKKMPDQGYEVKSFEKGLALVGSDSTLFDGYNGLTRLDKRGSSRGTYYAACDFVNRFLGVQYFFPGEYGTYRAAQTDLVIEPVHYADKPYFNGRGQEYYFNVCLGPGTKQWKNHWSKLMGKVDEENKCFRYWRIGSTNPTGGDHTPNPIWYAQEHPDKLKTIFYTSPNGKFWYHPTDYSKMNYNVIDLGLADLLVEDYKRVIDSDGKWNFGGNRTIGGKKTLKFGVCDVSMTIPDVLGDPTVEKLGLMTEEDIARGGDHAFANIYGRFHQYLANRCKELWPDSKFWIMAYYNCYYAPTDPKWFLPDNVEVNFCAREFPMRMRNGAAMAKTLVMMMDWYKALGNRPIQHLWLYNDRANLSARAICPEFIADIPKVCGKYLGTDGGMFMDYDCIVYDDVWSHYYSAWAEVMSEWNPDLDVDAAIDAHWELFYGKAAGKHLKRFHRILKEAYLKYYMMSNEAYPQYPIYMVDELEECLKLAEAELKPDSVEMKRFRLLSELWPAEFQRRRALAAYRPSTYKVARLAKGEKPDAAFWAKTSAMAMMETGGSGVTPENDTAFKLATDGETLYFHVDGNYATASKAGIVPFSNDTHVELFVTPGLGKEVNHMFAFDPAKNEHLQFQRLKPIPQPEDRTWKPEGYKLEVQVAADSWTGDMEVPLKVFGAGLPAAGDVWNVNALRTRRSHKTEGNSMVMRNHHDVVMYAKMEF